MTLSLLRNGTPAKEPVRAKIGTRLKTYSRTLSLKPPPLRYDGYARLVEERADLRHRAGELGGADVLAHLFQERLRGAADSLQLGAGPGKHRVGGIDEFRQVHALGDPVIAAHDDGAAGQVLRNLPLLDTTSAVAGRQHAHWL